MSWPSSPRTAKNKEAQSELSVPWCFFFDVAFGSSFECCDAPLEAWDVQIGLNQSKCMSGFSAATSQYSGKWSLLNLFSYYLPSILVSTSTRLLRRSGRPTMRLDVLRQRPLPRSSWQRCGITKSWGLPASVVKFNHLVLRSGVSDKDHEDSPRMFKESTKEQLCWWFWLESIVHNLRQTS